MQLVGLAAARPRATCKASASPVLGLAEPQGVGSGARQVPAWLPQSGEPKVQPEIPESCCLSVGQCQRKVGGFQLVFLMLVPVGHEVPEELVELEVPEVSSEFIEAEAPAIANRRPRTSEVSRCPSWWTSSARPRCQRSSTWPSCQWCSTRTWPINT